jgi:hypothetical protein
MTKRIELLNLDNYKGVWDTKTKKRLPHLYPNKQFMVKAKASAYEGGFTWLQSDDLKARTRKMGRFITMAEYRKLRKEFRKR